MAGYKCDDCDHYMMDNVRCLQCGDNGSLFENCRGQKTLRPIGSDQTPCSDAVVAIAQGCWIAKERDMLLDLTRMLDEHPEDYDGPCECQLCLSYSD